MTNDENNNLYNSLFDVLCHSFGSCFCLLPWWRPMCFVASRPQSLADRLYSTISFRREEAIVVSPKDLYAIVKRA